jgi:hypothetical protein
MLLVLLVHLGGSGCGRGRSQGELGVVTFNMLAPFYNSLAIDDWQQRKVFTCLVLDCGEI